MQVVLLNIWKSRLRVTPQLQRKEKLVWQVKYGYIYGRNVNLPPPPS